MRLFVAIQLDPQIKKQLAAMQRRLTDFDRAVRWVRPEQMHLTLKFLGEVPDERVDGVCEAARVAAAASQSFTISVGRCGCFPPRGRVRVLHAEVTEETGSLQRCRDRLEDAFEEQGFPKETRPFTPHLTVGRVREDRTGGRLRQAAEAIELEALPQDVSSLVVVQSVLSPAGARYTNLVCHKLSGGT